MKNQQVRSTTSIKFVFQVYSLYNVLQFKTVMNETGLLSILRQ